MHPVFTGRIESLHVHPAKPGEPLSALDALHLVASQGIVEDRRYFGRTNREGKPSRRQVSLIEREQLAEHAGTLGLANLPPGIVRSNIETSGIDLRACLGFDVVLGEAVIHVYEARTPCAKMDAICTGLRSEMEEGRQGVLATVVHSGRVRVGDPVRLLTERFTSPAAAAV